MESFGRRATLVLISMLLLSMVSADCMGQQGAGPQKKLPGANFRPNRDGKKKPAAREKSRKEVAKPGQTDVVPKDYSSKNFLIHTDLSPENARDLLKQLENMLVLISRYWGRPNRQKIECYVVENFDKWPADSFNAVALPAIRSGAGVTISQVRSRGDDFDAKATVYAVSQRGTPLHEVVHAYCAQTFGTTGPVWYSEGMAEMGHYWKDNDRSVNCDQYVVDYLHSSEPRQMLEIVKADQVSGDSWQNYAWRWALCHLLANNTNYNDRFRPLGLGLLTKQNVSFEDVYGPMAPEISFEYLFFLKHFERGYRVDLCSWDWKAKSRRPTGDSSVAARVIAARGWQNSRLRVDKDQVYEFSTEGNWKTAVELAETNADGADTGKGKLVAAIFDNYELSEEFELGASGQFVAPRDGDLMLRCRDAWSAIADNSGTIKVKLKRESIEAPPAALAKPPATADAK